MKHAIAIGHTRISEAKALMKHLIVIPFLLFVLLLPSHGEAAYAFVASVAAGSTDNSTITTAAINTTGANTIICYIGEQETVTDSTISDSKGNTWLTDVSPQSDVATANTLGRMFYCKNCAVGSGHTFTATDNGGGPKPSIACAAFSGGHTTAPLDQQNGKVDIDAGLSNTTNGITPSEDNTLTVSGLGFTPNSATIAINTGEAGWTITNQIDATVNHRGVALAYKIQTTATHTDPTWSYSSNEYAVTSIASFKVGAAASGARRGTLLGVGP